MGWLSRSLIQVRRKGLFYLFIWRLPAESIEFDIEGQAFLRSYNSAPRPTPSPLPLGKLDRRYTGRPRKRGNLLTGEGVGVNPNHPNIRIPPIKAFNPLWLPAFAAPRGRWVGESAPYDCAKNKSQLFVPLFTTASNTGDMDIGHLSPPAGQ